MRKRAFTYALRDRSSAARQSHISRTLTVEQRLNIYTLKSESCWDWTGYLNVYGYGQLTILGKKKLAHRISYEIYRGPIPNGMVIDHTCQNKKCVNPDHLEVVTNAENIRRRNHILWSSRNGCNKGHGIQKIYVDSKDRRKCKECDSLRHKEKRRSSEWMSA